MLYALVVLFNNMYACFFGFGMWYSVVGIGIGIGMCIGIGVGICIGICVGIRYCYLVVGKWFWCWYWLRYLVLV